jgi:hypothetical protein
VHVGLMESSVTWNPSRSLPGQQGPGWGARSRRAKKGEREKAVRDGSINFYFCQVNFAKH